MENDKIYGSLVVGYDDIKYDPKKLCDFVGNFLKREGFQFSRDIGDWDVGGADRFSIEPLVNKADVWPIIYILGKEQEFEKWAGGLDYSSLNVRKSEMKRILIFEEGGPTSYSFGNAWTFGLKLNDCLRDLNLRNFVPSVCCHDLVFDDGKVALSIRSFDGYAKFCEKFGRR